MHVCVCVQKYKAFVVSLSPQSLASLAVHYNLPDVLCAYQKVTTFFKVCLHDLQGIAA